MIDFNLCELIRGELIELGFWCDKVHDRGMTGLGAYFSVGDCGVGLVVCGDSVNVFDYWSGFRYMLNMNDPDLVGEIVWVCGWDLDLGVCW